MTADASRWPTSFVAAGFLSLLLVLVTSSCNRAKQTNSSSPKARRDVLSAVSAKLEEGAEGAQHHRCGPGAAARLKALDDELHAHGIASFKGRCKAFCSFFVVKAPDIPPDVSRIAVWAVASDEFDCDAADIIDNNGKPVATADVVPMRTAIVPEAPTLQWLSVYFYVSQRAPTTQPGDIFTGNQQVIPLKVDPASIRVRLRSSTGASSNYVPVLVIPSVQSHL